MYLEVNAGAAVLELRGTRQNQYSPVSTSFQDYAPSSIPGLADARLG